MGGDRERSSAVDAREEVVIVLTGPTAQRMRRVIKLALKPRVREPLDNPASSPDSLETALAQFTPLGALAIRAGRRPVTGAAIYITLVEARTPAALRQSREQPVEENSPTFAAAMVFLVSRHRRWFRTQTRL
jgi:hypothetical protein